VDRAANERGLHRSARADKKLDGQIGRLKPDQVDTTTLTRIKRSSGARRAVRLLATFMIEEGAGQ
jgi:hypothetical protein